MSVDLLYFGSLREALGRERERADLPSHVLTVADLVGWLSERGEPFASALAGGVALQAAVEAEMAGPGTTIFGAREVALFPQPGAMGGAGAPR
jgi:molybdopterin synthase sulfur carrier subunit